MKKFTKFLSSALLIGVLTLSFSACGSSKETTSTQKNISTTQTQGDIQVEKVDKPETVSIGYFTGNDDNVLIKEKGWFEEDLAKLGVKVKWVNFQAGRDMNNAMLAKSIDFSGGIGDPPVTIAVSSKIPYEIFWISNSIAESEALAARNKSNINSIKELKGKKIGTTVSSTAHYSLLSALELNGLKDSDVQIVDLNPQDIVAAWQRGDIDAAYTWEPNLSKLYSDGKKLISSKDLAQAGSPTTAYDIVRTEFAQKYPQIVALYIKSLIKANELYKSNPEGAAEVWAKTLNIDKAQVLKQASGNSWITPEEQLTSKYLGTSSKVGDTAKSLKKIGDFLVNQKSLPAKEELSVFEKIINPKYLEDALKNR
jgi:taurine transport system substrate-binding protein